MTKLRRSRPLLGTFVDIQVNDPDKNLVQLAREMNDAFAMIGWIHALMSFHSAESELTRISSRPGEWIKVSLPTYQVIRLARTLGRLTDNAFNCTVGGALVTQKLLPKPVDHSFLPFGSWQDIAIQRQFVKLRRPVLITLDGIAKGFAVDLAARVLYNHGIPQGLINAGGDMLAFGEQAFKVDVRTNSQSRHVSLYKAALASSQVKSTPAQRFPSLVVNSKGCDMQERLITVKAASAWRADALTKVAACVPTALQEQTLTKFGGVLIR